jgi:glutathione S-transferase
MNLPILYSFRRCPYAMRARMAIILSSKKCELREIVLKNKPQEMLQISAKGTVPILELTNEVLDESLDIISWAIKEKLMNDSLIQLFDSKFKYHLDRYKYASRYDANFSEHQQECKNILENLESKIDPSPWIFGEKVSLLDISILPFIRQCKIANPQWFFEQNFKKVIALLDFFEASDLFIHAMKKYDLWDPQNPNGSLFP